MPSFNVVPIATEVAVSVRESLRAPRYGHPAHVELAREPAPCRHCLRDFEPGADWRVLFTYDPFSVSAAPALPGPVYVHAERCEPYSAPGVFPPNLAAQGLTLYAYDRCGSQVARRQTTDPDGLHAALDSLIGTHDFEYVHVRNTRNGCFLCQVDPA